MPFALIVRFNANENPEKPSQIVSYLVVARLAPGRICVVGKVKPVKNANSIARKIADSSARRKCL